MSGDRGRRNESSRLGVLRFGDLGVQLPTTFRFKYLSLNDERNNICKHCSAATWKEESVNCCGQGKYVVHRLKPLPEGVLNAFSSAEFFRNQRIYNNLFSFFFHMPRCQSWQGLGSYETSVNVEVAR